MTLISGWTVPLIGHKKKREKKNKYRENINGRKNTETHWIEADTLSKTKQQDKPLD